MEPSARVPQVGDRLGALELRELLGEGGMGMVFRAYDHEHERSVAVKFLNLLAIGVTNENLLKEVRRRFAREAELLGRLRHPGIVELLAAEEDGEHPYLVLEFLGGRSLEEIRLDQGALPAPFVCSALLQVTKALRYAWTDHHVLHRDLKPGNIFVEDDGTAKLLDFGVARLMDPEDGAGEGVTRAGWTIGSPEFMSPEQHLGRTNLDCRSDLYALGVTLCTLLCGRLPFSYESDADCVRQKLRGLPFLIEDTAPETPPQLASLAYRLVEPSLERRLSSYAVVEETLHHCLQASVACERSAAQPTLPFAQPAPDCTDEPAPGRQVTLDLHGDPLPDSAPTWLEGAEISGLGGLLEQSQRLLDSLHPGMVIEGFRVGPLIGVGGMGAVFRGFDLTEREPVALKFLIPGQGDDDELLAQFRREADIIGRLRHEAIVQVRRICRTANHSFLAMDLFLGPHGKPVNLLNYSRDFGASDGLVDPGELRDIGLLLLDAVGHAHEQGVVHCDLKPENVLFQCLHVDGDSWDAKLKLTDFGLAKLIGEETIRQSVHQSLGLAVGDRRDDAMALVGTYEYMSPEQRRGHPAGPSADLYATGLILLRMLTGARQLRLGKRPSSLRPGLSNSWNPVLLRALRENPEDRFHSAHDFAEALALVDV